MQEKKSYYLSGKDQSDETQIEQLIRLGGKRDDIDPACRERVRQHLLQVWSQQNSNSHINPKNRSKKNLWYGAIAAGMLSFCIAIFFTNKPGSQEVVATITHLYGNTYLNHELLKKGESIHAGQAINTGQSNLELKWKDNGVLKLDKKTEIYFSNKDEIQLIIGAVYFDSNNKSNIRISTPQGIIKDIGTQFEARIQSLDLSIAVREGKVKLEKSKNESILIQSGKALNITREITSITDVKTDTNPWLWADAMEGSVNFDNHSMAEILLWLAQRENWKLEYKTEIDNQHAKNDILHGKFKTNNSRELLKQLSLISDMHYQISNNILIVSY